MAGQSKLSPAKPKQKTFSCPDCGKVFKHKNNVYAHRKSSCPKRPQERRYQCPNCVLSYRHERNLVEHRRRSCLKSIPIPEPEAVRVIRGAGTPYKFTTGVHKAQSAWNNFLDNYRIENVDHLIDISLYLDTMGPIVFRIFEHEIENKATFKANISLDVTLKKTRPGAENDDYLNWGIQTDNQQVTFTDESKTSVINNHFAYIKNNLSERMVEQSGWSLDAINDMMVKTTKVTDFYGGTYMRLPKYLANKKCLRNPFTENGDNKCFYWAIKALLYKGKYNRRILTQTLDQVPSNLDFSEVEYPTTISSVKKFAKKNKISINLYGFDVLEDKRIYPLDICDKEQQQHFDLLILQNDDKFHFVGISHFSKLVSRQTSKDGHKLFYCKRCFSHHYSAHDLAEHRIICNLNPLARVVLPKPDKNNQPPYIQFEDAMRCLDVPIVCYADFESILEPIQGVGNNPNIASTHAYQHHKPSSYALHVVSSYPADLTPDLPREVEVYRGADAAEQFVKRMGELSVIAKKIYQTNNKIKMTKAEKRQYNTATKCYICNKPFTAKNYKIREHCHLTRKYRGACHTRCNMYARNNRVFLPVLFHNLTNYDAHHIVTELGVTPGNVDCIPTSEEKLVAFSKKYDNGVWVRYIDSLRFLNESLDSLCNGLDATDFTTVRKWYPDDTEFNLLRRKGVFCYDYMDSMAKFNERQLPDKQDFYSKLLQEHITDEQYDHAKNVWTTFKCDTLGDYSDLYLKTDVMLLTDVFQCFRKMSKDVYGLDPCWYYTLPGLAWDACLKYTSVRLEKLTNHDMYTMIEKGIRGGICMVSKRHAVARNKHTNDPTGDTYIAYLDANNLYGWAMSKPLPTDGFEWFNNRLTQEDIPGLDPEGQKGYILEVDIEYPQHLHDEHRDLPFLAENIIPPGGKHKKLTPNLYHKKKYVIHYVALQQAMQHGLQVKKVHRVIRFNQSNWLAPYIDLNTQRRMAAVTKFAKNFFKLMNNAVYGKTMENVRKRIKMRLVTTKKIMSKLARKMHFKRRTIYNETMAAVHLHQKTVLLDKPMYIGLSVLDLSKTLMYDFHYNKMKEIFKGKEYNLLYMDTDSFIYEIRTDDLYKDMLAHAEYFDTSDYPEDHELYSVSNKKVLGKMKDEANSYPALEFIGLLPKLYFIEYGNKEVKKVKGVKTIAVKTQVTKRDFLKCLHDDTTKHVTYHSFLSKKHEIYSIEQTKLALSCNDDKRYIITPGGIETLPHGHYRIREDGELNPRKVGQAGPSTDETVYRKRPWPIPSDLSLKKRRISQEIGQPTQVNTSTNRGDVTRPFAKTLSLKKRKAVTQTPVNTLNHSGQPFARTLSLKKRKVLQQ